MDLLKAKIYIDKINRDFARMNKDTENILRIDVDIMMSYVRELYDALLSEEEPVAVVQSRQAPPQQKPPSPRQPEAAKPPEPVAAPPAQSPPPAGEAPQPEEKPAPAPPPPVVAESVKSMEPLPTMKPSAPPTEPPSFPSISPEADGLFEQKQAKELSEKLSELPIPDLRKSIALNDRLLLTRELFGNDNQAFDNTINALNDFQDMEQAKAYLLDRCVMRYKWTDKKRQETAKNFIKLIRRRYN